MDNQILIAKTNTVKNESQSLRLVANLDQKQNQSNQQAPVYQSQTAKNNHLQQTRHFNQQNLNTDIKSILTKIERNQKPKLFQDFKQERVHNNSAKRLLSQEVYEKVKKYSGFYWKLNTLNEKISLYKQLLGRNAPESFETRNLEDQNNQNEFNFESYSKNPFHNEKYQLYGQLSMDKTPRSNYSINYQNAQKKKVSFSGMEELMEFRNDNKTIKTNSGSTSQVTTHQQQRNHHNGDNETNKKSNDMKNVPQIDLDIQTINSNKRKQIKNKFLLNQQHNDSPISTNKTQSNYEESNRNFKDQQSKFNRQLPTPQRLQIQSSQLSMMNLSSSVEERSKRMLNALNPQKSLHQRYISQIIQKSDHVTQQLDVRLKQIQQNYPSEDIFELIQKKKEKSRNHNVKNQTKTSGFSKNISSNNQFVNLSLPDIMMKSVYLQSALKYSQIKETNKKESSVVSIHRFRNSKEEDIQKMSQTQVGASFKKNKVDRNNNNNPFINQSPSKKSTRRYRNRSNDLNQQSISNLQSTEQMIAEDLTKNDQIDQNPINNQDDLKARSGSKKKWKILKFNPDDTTPKRLEEMSNPNLGPGAYLGHKQFSNTKYAVAPFQSSQPREVNEVTNINPGPGEYQYTVGFNTQKSLFNPTIDNILNKLQRNKPAFNVKEPRFSTNYQLSTNSTLSHVGPGLYNLDKQQNWLKQNKNLQVLRAQSQLRNNNPPNLLQKSLTQNLQSNHSPPSIPSGDFKFGYKVEDDGYHVVSLKALEKKQEGMTYNDYSSVPGPGAYKNVDPMTKKRGGVVSYINDSSKRTKIELDSPTKVIGPGSYDLTKPIMIPLYKYDTQHLSSMFASQTKRQAASVDPLVKNKHKLKLQMRRMSNNPAILNNNTSILSSTSRNGSQIIAGLGSKSQLSGYLEQSINQNNRRALLEYQNDQELIDEEQDDEVDKMLEKITPGPGQYIDLNAISSFKKDFKHPQYQFFGSSAERFQPKNNLDSVLKSKLGPGCYETGKDGTNQPQKPTFKTVGFSSDIKDRFYVRDKGIPGPGHYVKAEVQALQVPHNQSHNKLITAFGTYEKRFVRRDNQVPGPGEYKPERSIQALTNKRHEILLGSSSFLAQDTERKISDPVLHHSPPVGSYNINKSSIMESDQKLQESTISPRKVQMLRSKSKEKPGFNSDVKRFDSTFDIIKGRDKMSPVRGPGYYDTQELTQIQPKKGPQDYFTQSKRFEYGSYLDKNKMKQIPGPGYYKVQTDHTSKKNKSFNLMFN